MTPDLLVSILLEAHEVGVPMCDNLHVVKQAQSLLLQRKDANDVECRQCINGERRVRFSAQFLKDLNKHMESLEKQAKKQTESILFLPNHKPRIPPAA